MFQSPFAKNLPQSFILTLNLNFLKKKIIYLMDHSCLKSTYLIGIQY